MNESLALFINPSGSIQIQPQPLEPLQPRQVRIRTRYTGACHAEDLFFLNRSHPQRAKFPKTWGCGIIEECGVSVSDWKTGDCILAPLHHQTRQNVETKFIHPIRNLKPEFSIFLNNAIPALQCNHNTHIKYGDQIAVLGLGSTGLMALQYALLNGATHITAIDPEKQRCRTAQRLGAHDVGNPNLLKAKRNTFDTVLECSGTGEALLQSEKITKEYGTITACGKHYTPDQVKPVIESCDSRKITFIQDHNNIVEGLEAKVIKSMQKKHVIVWPIPLHIIPFEQAPNAYAQMQQKPNQWIQMGLSYEKEIC